MLRLAALALLALTLMATGAQAQAPVPAQSSRAFGDSVGVNVRLTNVNSAYGDFETIYARLRELGVHSVLDYLCATCEWQLNRLQRLSQVGIKSTLGIHGGWAGGSPAIDSALGAIRNRLGGTVVGITGVNEPDLSGDPNWIAKTRAYTTDLYQRAKADPVLRGLPVIGPSLVFRTSRPALGDLSGVVDRGNLHPYPGGQPPLLTLEDERQMMSAVSAAKPLVITEVGYHSDLTEHGVHKPAPEDVIAAYAPRIPLEAFRFGVERTYFFQLVDPYSDAVWTQMGNELWHNRFGLLRQDLSPKPAFHALRNLLYAVDADSAPVSAPGALRYALEGAGPDVRQLLLRSADGSFRLALWRDASLWNRDTFERLAPAADHVDVVLGDPISRARRYDPTAAASATQEWKDPTRIGVDLGGAAVVLELIPPGTSADRAASHRGLRMDRRPARCKRGKPARRAAPRRAKRRATATWRRICVSARRHPRR